MEVQKRKILVENNIDRTYDSPTWGTVTATTFYVNVFLTQTIDDMGLFMDIDYIPKIESVNQPPDYQLLIDKLSASGITFPFMNPTTVPPVMTGITGTNRIVLRLPESVESDFYLYGNAQITGYTDSKIDDLKSYKKDNQYRTNFDVDKTQYINYLGNTVLGVDRIKSMGEPRIYVFNTPDDSNLGTNTQIHGLQYHEYTGKTRQVVFEGVKSTIPVTNFMYLGQGWNETNISLSALTKEEYLFGIISKPETQSDVFIERGLTSVMDRHLKLGEISNLGELTKYGNGFYKLNA